MSGVLHIVVARKPIEGTVAENCLRWGCGALWIDGCRVVTKEGDWKGKGGGGVHQHWQGKGIENDIYEDGFIRAGVDHATGRFPANLILSGEEVVEGFPDARGAVSNGRKGADGACFGHYGVMPQQVGRADSGSAARFFFNYNEQESDDE